jgi:hypothetical protein
MMLCFDYLLGGVTRRRFLADLRRSMKAFIKMEFKEEEDRGGDLSMDRKPIEDDEDRLADARNEHAEEQYERKQARKWLREMYRERTP